MAKVIVRLVVVLIVEFLTIACLTATPASVEEPQCGCKVKCSCSPKCLCAGNKEVK